MTEQEADESEDETQSGIQEGDFILVDYTATTEEGTVVDTTRQEVADEEGLDEEGRSFEPQPIIVGEGQIFEEVEDEIVGEDVGDSGEITISAENAFGEYDPENVETVNVKKIDEENRYPGAQVEVDGQQGYIETVVGGRARVDFNHPLAGQDIEYDFEVVDTVEGKVEKAEALVLLNAGAEVDVTLGTETKTETEIVETDEGDEIEEEEEVDVETLYIEQTPELSMNQNWIIGKNQVAQEIIDQLDVDRVVVRETIDAGEGMGMGMGGLGPEVVPNEGGEEVSAEEIAEDIQAAEEHDHDHDH